MTDVAIVYWSGTGNTEAMAKLVAEGVESAGKTAELISAENFNVLSTRCLKMFKA